MEQLLATPSFTPYSKTEYFHALTTHIKKARPGGRVLLTTMTLNPTEPLAISILDELAEAAKRGVHVDFAFDAYNYLINPVTKLPGPLLVRGKLPDKSHGIYKQFQTIVERLQHAGVKVAITNRPANPRKNPFSSRSHIKTAVIDDLVFVGGCNLSKHSDIDMMVSFSHAATAKWLYKTMRAAIHAPKVSQSLQGIDQQYPIDSATTLLIDAGLAKQSTIYDHALRFIDEAQEWLVLTCQFFPNSVTASRLLAAHRRGVDIKILYNHPFQHAGLQHKILQSMVHERERLRLPASFFANRLTRNHEFIHAKLLASEQGAIVGSHNYVNIGVQFGTAEIALVRNDPAFGSLLAKQIEAQIS